MDVTDGMPLFINFNQDRSLVAIGTARVCRSSRSPLCSLPVSSTMQGYMIYQCEPLTLMYSKPDCRSVRSRPYSLSDMVIGFAFSCSIVEMLFRSSLVALVGMCDRPSNSMRKVQIWWVAMSMHACSEITVVCSFRNTKTDKRLQEINYDTAVLALKMNMKR